MLFCSPLIDLLCCFIVLANQRIHLFVVVNLPRSLVVANTMSVIPSLIRRFIYHMFACLPRIVWLHLLRCTFRRRSHLYHFRLVLVSWRFTKIPSTEIGYGSSLLSIFAFLSFLPPRSCGIQSIWRVLAFNYCPYIPRTLLLWLYFFISTRHTKLKGNCYLVGCSYLLLK